MAGYPQPGYPQQGYTPGYPQPGYVQPGYTQPGYSQPNQFSQPSYQPSPGFQQPPTAGFVTAGYPSQGEGFVPPGGGYPAHNADQRHGGNYGAGVEIGEDEDVKGFDFTDKSIRLGFIRKVYAILMCQLLVTFGFISLCIFHKPVQRYIMTHQELWWIALVVMLVSLIAMSCCSNVRRKAPMNYIFLSVFTLAETFMLGTVASTYDTIEVLIAVGITAIVCLGLTLFAFQTKWDFTTMGGILVVALLIMLMFGICSIFFYNRILTIIYSALGAFIFSVYLVYDTQLMMGGNHKYSISPEEYIFAALNLYLDVINIFLYILALTGAAKD